MPKNKLVYIEKKKKFKLIAKNIISKAIIKKKLLLNEKNKLKRPVKNIILVKIKDMQK